MSPEWAFLISHALLVLMKIVCFILGYLTIRLGYKLISDGVRGSFKFSASLGGVKADLASVSPGLLFVTLGVFLIGYAIYVEKEVHFKPAPLPPVASQAAPDVALPDGPSFRSGSASTAGDEPRERGDETE